MRKRRLFLLPIEPLEERYSCQWFSWLPESFGQAFDVVNIEGVALTDRVQTGAFLDLNSTLHYKAAQLQRVAKLFYAGDVRDGDCFFVADIEFWGVEAIRYLAVLQGIDVRVFGFLHAASYTTGDFMSPMAPLGALAEPLWIAACDKVFVGSHYHAKAVAARRLAAHPALRRRVVVTGNPWRTEEARELARTSPLYGSHRDIDVLFPHRPDAEKGIERFLRVAREEFSDLRVAFTTGRAEYRSTNCQAAADEIVAMSKRGEVQLFTGLKRADFYALLARARVVVSTAIEENFGYAMVEAMAMGALPAMPRAFSYEELAPRRRKGWPNFLYTTDRQLVRCVRDLLEAGPPQRLAAVSAARRHDGAEGRILAEMLKE